jgi:hypothetical protein
MKSPLIALSFILLAASALQAQTPPAVKVDVKAPKIINIQTPQFQAGNTPARNWRPKEWLEVDVELSIKLPQAAGGRNGSLASLTINYYIAMNAQKDGKYQLLKGSLNYVDVPAGERCHALAYVSPATLRRVLEKDNFTAGSDMKAYAIEVVVDGQVVAGDTSVAGKWWEKTDAFIANESVILTRKDTPFDILWGDYDLPTKSK